MSRAIAWPTEQIKAALAPLLPGFRVEVLARLDSTNTELMRRARNGQMEPVLLVAEQQTAGRGRLGRQWFSGEERTSVGASFAAGPSQGEAAPAGLSPAAPALPAQGGTGRRVDASDVGLFSAVREATSVGAIPSLTFSLGLPLSPPDWSGLSLAVGLSVVQSLHPDLRLKWPNDVWWQERKLAGILIETASFGDVRYAVVGIGINIEAPAATGLRWAPAWLGELLPGVDAAQALLRIAAPLGQAIKLFERHGFAPFQAHFNERDALVGLNVTLGDATVGVAQGVDGAGALRVHTAAGLRRITSDEVSVRPLSLQSCDKR